MWAGAGGSMFMWLSARHLFSRAAGHSALQRRLCETDSQLHLSEARFRALVAATSDVLYRMSPDWSVMCHLDGGKFIDDTNAPDRGWMKHYIPAEEQPIVMSAIEQAIRTKSTFELEHRVVRCSGDIGWTFSRAVPLLNKHGQIAEWFGAARDITKRKTAEEALLRSERLASLGRMAATISHEINNPLEAIINLLFLAENTEGLPGQAREYLDEVVAELGRVTHITRQALGFYRESAAPAEVSLDALVNSALDLVKRKAAGKHVIIDKQFRDHPKITAIGGELRQVVSNLLVNSVDAIGERGIVKVRISPGLSSDGQRTVRITIADNGSGIAPAARQHIFEPLFTTKGAVGTGLGLWVAGQIVQKHGGKIQMRSSEGGPHRGSTFSVLLPA
jgi:signal transduction histidine kinase